MCMFSAPQHIPGNFPMLFQKVSLIDSTIQRGNGGLERFHNSCELVRSGLRFQPIPCAIISFLLGVRTPQSF